MRRPLVLLFLFLAGAGLSACAVSSDDHSGAGGGPNFDKDRAAILAMAGNYKVSFNFTETVSFVEGYELKKPYLTGGDEVVRVIADTGEFISLQHILVVGGDDKMPIKHWRQDWVYEPSHIFEYVGNNKWQRRALSLSERRGKWGQLVYQVDDSPRYAAVAAWDHSHNVSSWTSPPSLRPLPRRDATTRDDYDAILAINRHALTPQGWVHEQDNSKLILSGSPQTLVREIGVNSYEKYEGFDFAVADDYWATTKAYWADVRDAWSALETDHAGFGLTLKGEPEELYMQLLEVADKVQAGTLALNAATDQARDIIDTYTFTDGRQAATPEPPTGVLQVAGSAE